MTLPRDIELLYEIGSLRNVPRGWRQHLGMDCASDLEHTMRVAFLAMILGRHEGKEIDEKKLLKMALTHDIVETRLSDFSYVQKAYIPEINEIAVMKEMFQDTALEDIVSVCEEYEHRQSLEAKLVKDADNLDIDIELKELEEQGSKLPEKWKGFRERIRREKLYTESAKKMWDEIQNSDPSSWHIATNKWLRKPSAGS